MVALPFFITRVELEVVSPEYAYQNVSKVLFAFKILSTFTCALLTQCCVCYDDSIVLDTSKKGLTISPLRPGGPICPAGPASPCQKKKNHSVILLYLCARVPKNDEVGCFKHHLTGFLFVLVLGLAVHPIYFIFIKLIFLIGEAFKKETNGTFREQLTLFMRLLT